MQDFNALEQALQRQNQALTDGIDQLIQAAPAESDLRAQLQTLKNQYVVTSKRLEAVGVGSKTITTAFKNIEDQLDGIAGVAALLVAPNFTHEEIVDALKEITATHKKRQEKLGNGQTEVRRQDKPKSTGQLRNGILKDIDSEIKRWQGSEEAYAQDNVTQLQAIKTSFQSIQNEIHSPEKPLSNEAREDVYRQIDAAFGQLQPRELQPQEEEQQQPVSNLTDTSLLDLQARIQKRRQLDNSSISRQGFNTEIDRLKAAIDQAIEAQENGFDKKISDLNGEIETLTGQIQDNQTPQQNPQRRIQIKQKKEAIENYNKAKGNYTKAKESLEKIQTLQAEKTQLLQDPQKTSAERKKALEEKETQIEQQFSELEKISFATPAQANKNYDNEIQSLHGHSQASSDRDKKAALIKDIEELYRKGETHEFIANGTRDVFRGDILQERKTDGTISLDQSLESLQDYYSETLGKDQKIRTAAERRSTESPLLGNGAVTFNEKGVPSTKDPAMMLRVMVRALETKDISLIDGLEQGMAEMRKSKWGSKEWLKKEKQNLQQLLSEINPQHDMSFALFKIVLGLLMMWGFSPLLKLFFWHLKNGKTEQLYNQLKSIKDQGIDLNDNVAVYNALKKMPGFSEWAQNALSDEEKVDLVQNLLESSPKDAGELFWRFSSDAVRQNIVTQLETEELVKLFNQSKGISKTNADRFVNLAAAAGKFSELQNALPQNERDRLIKSLSNDNFVAEFNKLKTAYKANQQDETLAPFANWHRAGTPEQQEAAFKQLKAVPNPQNNAHDNNAIIGLYNFVTNPANSSAEIASTNEASFYRNLSSDGRQVLVTEWLHDPNNAHPPVPQNRQAVLNTLKHLLTADKPDTATAVRLFEGLANNALNGSNAIQQNLLNQLAQQPNNLATLYALYKAVVKEKGADAGIALFNQLQTNPEPNQNRKLQLAKHIFDIHSANYNASKHMFTKGNVARNAKKEIELLLANLGDAHDNFLDHMELPDNSQLHNSIFGSNPEGSRLVHRN